jgi:hypothetical protein
MKTPLQVIWFLCTVFITAPIWYYLLYQVLVRVEATELMWFLYWIYVPVSLLLAILLRIVEKMPDA